MFLTCMYVVPCFRGETGHEQIEILVSQEKGNANLYGVKSQMMNATFYYARVKTLVLH